MLAGCSSGDGSPREGEEANGFPAAGEVASEPVQALNAAALSTDEHTAYTFFVGKGLTPVQAAGIVGNLIQESNVEAGAVQPGGPGRGIAQWSVGGRWDTSKSDNVVWYAGKEGLASSSLTLQASRTSSRMK